MNHILRCLVAAILVLSVGCMPYQEEYQKAMEAKEHAEHLLEEGEAKIEELEAEVDEVKDELTAEQQAIDRIYTED